MLSSATISIIIFSILLIVLLIFIFINWRPEDQTIFSCSKDQCATSLSDGNKRCPPISGVIEYDPTKEVCNSRFLCDNINTPFALQTDYSTNDSGVCGVGIECACLSKRTCPIYVTSTFQSQNGNILNYLDDQRLFLQQQNYYLSSDNLIENGPLIIENQEENFCFIPSNVLDRLWPKNCLIGTLALIETDEVKTGFYSCVRGVGCSNNQMTIYNTNQGSIRCEQSF